jgi:hypothetical protein
MLICRVNVARIAFESSQGWLALVRIAEFGTFLGTGFLRTVSGSLASVDERTECASDLDRAKRSQPNRPGPP